MSLNTLLESANPYKALQDDANRLAQKWAKTGLLEGMNSEVETNKTGICSPAKVVNTLLNTPA